MTENVNNKHTITNSNSELINDTINKCNELKYLKFKPKQNMIYSMHAGYSSLCSLNTILSCIFSDQLFVKLSKKPKDLTLNELFGIVKNRIVDDEPLNIELFPNIQINVTKIECDDGGEIDDNDDNANDDDVRIGISAGGGCNSMRISDINAFSKIFLELMDDSERYCRTYYIAKFNKQPLFYNNEEIYSKLSRMKYWISKSNYYSPIVSCCYVNHRNDDNDHLVSVIDDNDDTNTDNNDSNDNGNLQENMHVLVMDVDHKNEPYLVPIKQMFEAIKCKDHNGIQGGLIKIEAQLIL